MINLLTVAISCIFLKKIFKIVDEPGYMSQRLIFSKNILELQIKILINMYVQKKDRNNTFTPKVLINRRILIILNGLLRHLQRCFNKLFGCNDSDILKIPF